jgi:hypothetical protein
MEKSCGPHYPRCSESVAHSSPLTAGLSTSPGSRRGSAGSSAQPAEGAGGPRASQSRRTSRTRVEEQRWTRVEPEQNQSGRPGQNQSGTRAEPEWNQRQSGTRARVEPEQNQSKVMQLGQTVGKMFPDKVETEISWKAHTYITQIYRRHKYMIISGIMRELLKEMRNKQSSMLRETDVTFRECWSLLLHRNNNEKKKCLWQKKLRAYVIHSSTSGTFSLNTLVFDEVKSNMI